MEKIRYGGTIFGLVPGGFDAFSEDKLTIRHQKGDKTLDQIKAIAKTVTASDSIDLLDDAGEVIRSLDGYIYAGDIREIEDYLIEERQIPVSPAKPDEESTVQPENGIESDKTAESDETAEFDETAEAKQELTYTVQEIRADVAVVAFKLPDVRTELERVQEELQTMNAVQEEMLVSMLEGGM